MNTRKIASMSLVALWAVVLVGCTTEKESDVGLANPASQYCEENGWTLELIDGSWICNFNDWSYCEERSYYRWECVEWDIMKNTITDEFVIEDNLLTEEDIESFEENNFPKGYTYTIYNSESEETTTWSYEYPEDLSHTLLLPIHATMANREIISSWIEDDMIYTLTNVTLQDDTVVSVLYINDPESKNFVAANVENWNETTNYQFIY